MWEWLSQMISNGSTGQALAGGADRGVWANLFDNPGGVFSSTPIVGQAAAAQGTPGAVEGTQIPGWKDPAILASVLGNFGAALAPQGSWQQALGGMAGMWGGNQLYGRAAQNTMAANQPAGSQPYQSPLQPTPIMTGMAAPPPGSPMSTMLPSRESRPSLLPTNLSAVLSGYGMQPPPMMDTRLLGSRVAPGGF